MRILALLAVFSLFTQTLGHIGNTEHAHTMRPTHTMTSSKAPAMATAKRRVI